MRDLDEAEFLRWAQARRPALRRLAFYLSTDWHLADDLVQETLTRIYLAWPRLVRRGQLDAYARRTLTNAFLGSRRRPWRREVPTDVFPETAGTSIAIDAIDGLDAPPLLAALRSIPPGQRAVLALRFLEDLSVEQTAEVLGCQPGTVKSQTSRGLSTLRERLGDTTTRRAP